MSRRRVANIWIVVLAVVPAAAVVLGLLLGDQERIVRYQEQARLTEYGAGVTEVIDYDFGAGNSRHGIIRVVPGLSDESPVDVHSDTAPDDLKRTGGELRIGDPDVTVDGTHRYEIGYGIGTLRRGNTFAWNVVGNEWQVPIETVLAEVISEFELSSPTCDRGGFGDVGGCEVVQVGPRRLSVEVHDLDAGEAVTVRARIGELMDQADWPASVLPDPLPPVRDTGAPLLVPTLLGFVAAATAGLATGGVLRYAGRDHAPGGVAAAAVPDLAEGPPPLPGTTGVLAAGGARVDPEDLVAGVAPRPAPPTTLTPAEGGVVLTERVRTEHQAAWLLGQAHRGAIRISGDPDQPTLTWLGGHGAESNQPLLTMFAGRPTFDLDGYDEHFAAGWTMVGAELEAWQERSGLWSPAGERRRRWAIGIGFVLVLVGLVDAGLLAWRWSLTEPSVLALAALTLPVGIGVGLMARAWELRVRTAAGSAAYLEVEAFRRWLAEVEADDLERAADAGVLHDHLAWAVALGAADEWTGVAARTSVGSRVDGFDSGSMLVASGLSRSASSASTVPSSSGGGGGGGAGGGGGGGGGGSW